MSGSGLAGETTIPEHNVHTTLAVKRLRLVLVLSN